MNELIKINKWEEGKYTSQELSALTEFEKAVPHLPTFFKEYSATTYGCYYDVIALNKTGGTEHVELKLRDKSTRNNKDCFIEMEKWINLIADWRERNIAPLYFNMIGDHKDIYMWFLPEIMYVNTYIGIKVRSDNGNYEIVDRLGLHWDNAHHFVWDEETQSYNHTSPKIRKIISEKAVKYDKNSN